MANNVEHLDLSGESDFPFQLQGQTTDNRDNDFYTNADNSRPLYSKPLQTITIRHDGVGYELTYRQARNLLMQSGPLRNHFRNYKRECNNQQIPGSHGKHCHSLKFRNEDDTQYSVEGCLNDILSMENNNIREALLQKLTEDPRTWRDHVKRSWHRNPRLDSTTTRPYNRNDVTGERPPQRLRGEVEAGGHFKAFHTISSDVSMQKGAIKHRLNINREQYNSNALSRMNYELIRGIITNLRNQFSNQNRNEDHFMVQYQEDIDGDGIRFEEVNEANEVTGCKKYRIYHKMETIYLIPRGTILNIHHANVSNPRPMLKTPCVIVKSRPGSFDVIMPIITRDGYTMDDIFGFDFDVTPTISDSRSVMNVVPRGRHVLSEETNGLPQQTTNGFNTTQNHIIGTGNTNGTLGVPMLLAKAGILRKDTTRSTIERRNASRNKVCRDIDRNKGKAHIENYELRVCHADDYRSHALTKKKDVRIRKFHAGGDARSSEVAVRQYNLDEALDIMIAPDPSLRTGQTPFEVGIQRWQQADFENEVIRILREAADDGKITGNMLLKYLQDTYPDAYKLPFTTTTTTKPATKPTISSSSENDSSSESSGDEGSNSEDDMYLSDNENDTNNDMNTRRSSLQPLDNTAVNSEKDRFDNFKPQNEKDLISRGNSLLINKNTNDTSDSDDSDDESSDSDNEEEIFMKNGGTLRIRRKKKKTKKRR